MKATGIVRSIDSLGRFVLPKEIRHNLNLKQFAQLEIFVSDEGDIILKKFSPLASSFEFAANVCEGLSSTLSCSCFVTSDENIVAGSSNIKPYAVGAKILPSYFKQITAGITMSNSLTNQNTLVNIFNDQDGGITAQMAQPIMANGVCIGSIIAFTKQADRSFSSADILVLQTSAKILGSIAD